MMVIIKAILCAKKGIVVYAKMSRSFGHTVLHYKSVVQHFFEWTMVTAVSAFRRSEQVPFKPGESIKLIVDRYELGLLQLVIQCYQNFQQDVYTSMCGSTV